MQTMQMGEAQISLFSIGDLRCDLAEWLDLPHERWPVEYTADLEQPQHVPVQCVHISLPGLSLLVDVPRYDEVREGSTFGIPGYRPPPGLLEQLTAVGIAPEEITHIVITHLHFDHFSGVTQMENGRYVPTFPNARCYLSRKDWMEVAKNLKKPGSLTNRTLGILEQNGLLELVEGECQLADGVTILPAPGETPGHQIVRVHSADQTLYILGDLYHHAIEFEHPLLNVSWAIVEQMAASKEALIHSALAENAMLAVAHIPGFGRLHPIETGVVWTRI